MLLFFNVLNKAEELSLNEVQEIAEVYSRIILEKNKNRCHYSKRSVFVSGPGWFFCVDVNHMISPV